MYQALLPPEITNAFRGMKVCFQRREVVHARYEGIQKLPSDDHARSFYILYILNLLYSMTRRR